MDVGDGNPGMDRKLKQNIKFGFRILTGTEEILQTAKRVLGRLNMKWM